jgi:uncharacterized membrane protein
MARVLVIGESWFTYSVHQKGFDAFYASEYVEGAAEFLGALGARGHEVTYVPSHEIHARVPSAVERLERFDVVVISDVGANSFQLPPETFGHSVPSADKSDVIRQYVERGGGLLMIGGYLTFSGIDAKARWGRSPLGAALPVDVLDRDDRVELPGGAEPKVVASHDIVADLADTWPALLGLNEVTAKVDATVIAECAGYPLVVAGHYGAGRSAVFTSDIAPHWAPPGFLAWDGYPRLWDQFVRWLSNSGA